MAQYRTGTVEVTNGDATVTGVGTSWLSNLSVGDIFIRIGDSVPYYVGSITNDTSLELTAPYVGVTGSGVSYAVTTDFTPNSALGLLSPADLETAITFNANMTAIDEALTDRPTNADLADVVYQTEGVINKLAADVTLASGFTGLVVGTDGLETIKCTWYQHGSAILGKLEIDLQHAAKLVSVGDRFSINNLAPFNSNFSSPVANPLALIGQVLVYKAFGSNDLATFNVIIGVTTSTLFFECIHVAGSASYGDPITGTFTYFVN